LKSVEKKASGVQFIPILLGHFLGEFHGAGRSGEHRVVNDFDLDGTEILQHGFERVTEAADLAAAPGPSRFPAGQTVIFPARSREQTRRSRNFACLITR